MATILANSDLTDIIISVIIFGLVIGFSVISKLIQKAREVNSRSDDDIMDKAMAADDLWRSQTPGKAAAKKQKRLKPPPLPPGKTKPHPLDEARPAVAKTAHQQFVADRGKTASGTAYEVTRFAKSESCSEEAYSSKEDAYELHGNRKRRKNSVLQSLRNRHGARQALIAREIIEPPRAFDI